MNIKKLGLITLLSAASLLAACTGGTTSSSSAQSSSAAPYVGTVKVYFYIDFTQPDSGEYYDMKEIQNGNVVAAPSNPTTPKFEEFPVFLGWSEKELISSKDDLWDFSKDIVNISEGETSFSLYGIWVAQGEN